EPRFDVVSRVAGFLALRVKNGNMPGRAILNTNVPNIPLEQIKGIVTTRTGSSGYVGLTQVQGSDTLSYSIGMRPADSPNYPDQLANPTGAEEGTDIWAINSGLISITPLSLDVTAHDLIPSLNEHVSSLESDLMNT
ncbi:MAG: hypothetical protein JSW16_07325, partial [Dehalococcoidales bacterium]